MKKLSKKILEDLAKKAVDKIEEDMAMMPMGGAAAANGAMNPPPAAPGTTGSSDGTNTTNASSVDNTAKAKPADSFTLQAVVTSKNAPFNGSRLQTDRGAHLAVSKVASVINLIGKDKKSN